MAYSVTCRDNPDMAGCPGHFQAATEEEVWKHVEVHAKMAHDIDLTALPPEMQRQLRKAIKQTDTA